MASTITVSSSAELYNALSHATGGETVVLAAGDYGKLGLYSSPSSSFPSNITITSADPLNPATFSSFDIRNVSGLTLDSLVFDYEFTPGEASTVTPFRISGGDNISVCNSTFDGDVASGTGSVADGFGNGFGLYVRGTTGLNIEGNEFSDFYKGTMVYDCDDVRVIGNDVHDIRSDGMDFSLIHGAVIEDNYIHDFKASPTSLDHQDMIQFWTVGTTEPSTDIVIRGNRLDIGEGSLTQSIFMRNEVVDSGLAGEEMFYRNITIEDNIITNAHVNGITVGETVGLVITQNAVLHADGNRPDGSDTPVEIPRIYLAPRSIDVTVTGNVTSGISGWTTQPTWTVSQNAFVQDQNPGTPGYYADVFLSSSLTAQDGVHAFLAVPGGMVALLGAGPSEMLNYLPEAGGVAAVFQTTADPDGSSQNRIFDARFCLSDMGVLPEGAVFEWSFGDGTTATGLQVLHHFEAGGHYEVSLTVLLPNGASDTVVGTIGVQSSNIVTLGANGTFWASEYSDMFALATTGAASAAGLQLGATGVAAAVALTHVAELQQAHDFDISLRLNADSLTSSGEIFRLHGGILASVNIKGEIQIQAYPDVGSAVMLTSTGLSITDLKSHDIDIRLHDGVLQLWVDGSMASQAAFAGTLKDYSFYNFTFGNQWGGKNFLGDLTGFDITVGKSDLADAKTILSLGTDGTFYTATAASAAAMVAEATATIGLHLGDSGVAASVDGNFLTDLLHTDSFNVSLTLDADRADSSGLIFRLHDSLVGRVLTTGQLVVRAFEQDGTLVRLISSGTPFTDLKSHDIDIRLQDGKLQLWIDNSLSAEASFDGTLQDLNPRALDFGNINGALNFSGDLTAFDITVANDSGWTSASGVVL